MSDDRVIDLKERHREIGLKILDVQRRLSEHRAARFHMHARVWNETKASLMREWLSYTKQSGDMKAELRRLSGTTGPDPKWLLLARCYRLLERLEEQGVDIGEEGGALIDEIMFHVSPAMLDAAKESSNG